MGKAKFEMGSENVSVHEADGGLQETGLNGAEKSLRSAGARESKQVQKNVAQYVSEKNLQETALNGLEEGLRHDETCRSKKDPQSTAMHVSRISILINMLLSAGKLLAGIFASSGAMISDAVHSASDVFSTIIVMIGIRLSGKAADKEHPYGHERMECVAAILLAVVLALTGLKIGASGIEKIGAGNYEELQVPGFAALAAAVISILVKEWMYWYTRFHAKRINSAALMADAWHHRSDALSSVGAFVGIFGARMGFPVMDPLASVVISIFILKAAYDIFQDAVDKMVDKACDDKVEKELRDFVLKQEGVLGIDLLRTREFGSRIYVDVDIIADGRLTLSESHKIAERVHSGIEKNFEQVKHIMVHVNPGEPPKERMVLGEEAG